MKVIAQRVSSAKVSINKETHASIDKGILAYVCFEKGDEVFEYTHNDLSFSVSYIISRSEGSNALSLNFIFF